MSDKVVKNWLNLAEYDLQTAEVMLEGGRYLYVAFMCQQAVEKILKAIYVQEFDQTPPYTHNLIRLVDKLSISDSVDDDLLCSFEKLNSFYIECRYTEVFDELTLMLDYDTSNDILIMAKDLFKWLRTKL